MSTLDADRRRFARGPCPADIFSKVSSKTFDVLEPLHQELERSPSGAWISRALGRESQQFTHARVGVAFSFFDNLDMWLDECANTGQLPEAIDSLRRAEHPSFRPLAALIRDFLSDFPLAPALAYCHDYTHVREQYVAHRQWGTLRSVKGLPPLMERVGPNTPLFFDVDHRRSCRLDLRTLPWKLLPGLNDSDAEFVRSTHYQVEHRPDGSQAGIIFTQRVCVGRERDADQRLLILKAVPPAAAPLAMAGTSSRLARGTLSPWDMKSASRPLVINAPVLRFLRLFESVPNPGPFDVASDELSFLLDRDSGELLSITTESRLLWPYDPDKVVNTRWFNWVATL